ncbi:MAG TPA: NB-ARC domain-containing protein, partial [Ktedonobacteraceae bacterium]|nr:NB-ARC domain-containing protein [Ktedonobacteraceae bacterium]
MRSARQQKGIPLTKMSDLLEYSKGYLSSVENKPSPPPLSLIEKYEQTLGLKQGELSGTLPTAEKKPENPLPEESQSRALASNILKEGWGEAPAVSTFYGRQDEVTTLTHWIVEDKSQVIVVLGLGGIGKTTLAAAVTKEIRALFDFTVWISFHDRPPVENIVTEALAFLADHERRKKQFTEIEHEMARALGDKDAQIHLLLAFLKKHRCLLVFDNLEAVLNSSLKNEKEQKNHNDYAMLIQRFVEADSQSCLLITSREKLWGISALEVGSKKIHSLQLGGLKTFDALQLLEEKNLFGTDRDKEDLVDFYAGNPLALNLVTEFILEVFEGNLGEFILEGRPIFGGVYDLLKQQFRSLLWLEREIMYWLAIGIEESSLEDLEKDLVRPVAKRDLINAIDALQRRSMVEKKAGARFHLQPVIMEFVIGELVEHAYHEIEQPGEPAYTTEIDRQQMHLLESHALIKAQAREYIREQQLKLILRPVADRLFRTFGLLESTKKLKDVVLNARTNTFRKVSYIAGNIINLLVQLQVDLRGYDFSSLTIRQAYLQSVTLHNVNFEAAHFVKSVFTDTFGSILSAALSPSGRYLAVGTANGMIRLWNAEDSTPLLTFKGHTNWVRSVAFSPDEKRLASGSDDTTIRFWDVETGQCLKTLKGHTHRVRPVVFSPDGKLLASGSDDQTIRFWDVVRGECLKILTGHTHRIRSVVFSPDGKLLASGSDDQTIRLWDVATRKHLKTLKGHTHRVRVVAFNLKGEFLASGGDDTTIRFWDISTGECFRELNGHEELVRSMAFKPDGKILASGSDDRTIRLWNISTGECINILTDHQNAVRSVAFSPDGQRLVSGSDDQTVRFWSESGKSLKTLQGYSTWIYSVAFNPDMSTAATENMLASGGHDNAVRLWDLRIGECTQVFQGHRGLIYSVAFSPDGKLLASGSLDHKIRLWDIATGECLMVLHGHENQINSVAFNFDGTRLASGSEDNMVRLWDVSTGECLFILHKHENRVRSVAFSPDRETLVSGSEDTTVRLWNVNTGLCLKVLRGHTDQVRSVTFSPDGSLL